MLKRQYYTSVLLLLFLMAVRQGYAQFKDNTEFNIWYAKPGDTFRVYGKMANVRSGPDKAAAITDSLACGTLVTIKELGTTLESVKGIYAPWVKVQYHAGGPKEGYIWLGMLALQSYTRTDGTCFLYGIERIEAPVDKKDDYVPASWYIRVRALNTVLQLLDEKEYKMSGGETSVTGGQLLGNMGLENTIDVLRIYFGGEACGIPTNYYYFAWTGTRFLPLPGKMEVGDAGVFYHTETFLFPKEKGGQPGKIIKLSEEGEADEEKVDKKGEPVFKIKKSREVYLWDGTKAKKQ